MPPVEMINIDMDKQTVVCTKYFATRLRDRVVGRIQRKMGNRLFVRW